MKLALRANYAISLEINAKTGCCNLLIYCHLILAMTYMLRTKKKVGMEAIQFHYVTF